MKKTTGASFVPFLKTRLGGVGSFMRAFRDWAVRAFDGSLVARLLRAFRERVPYVRNRVVGTFLLTFGAYSALIAVFKSMLALGKGRVGLYFSLCVAICAIPLLISRGTVYTMLSNSHTGRVISRCIGIRLQAMGGTLSIGRENVAFLLGMIAGTITLVFDPVYVLGVPAAVLVAGLILTYPESAVVFLAVTLPFGNAEVFLFISFMGVAAFIIKLIRGKRHLAVAPHIKTALLLTAVILFLDLLEGSVFDGAVMMACLMLAVSERNGAKAESVAAASVSSCACMAAVYVMLRAVAFFAGLRAQTEFFDVSSLALLCTALIPLAVSFMISGEIMPRKTGFLSAAVMTAFLIMTNSYLHAVSAAMGTVLMLFMYKRRIAYFLTALMSAGYAVWVWLGGSNRLAFDTLVGFLTGLGIDKQGVSAGEMIYGEGIGGGLYGGDNFYGSLIKGIGIVGTVIFAVAVIFLAVYVLKQKNKESSEYGFLTAFGAFCSVFTLLVCGAGANIWNSERVFVLFWVLFAVGSSIAENEAGKARGSEYASMIEDNSCCAEMILSPGKGKGK